MQRVFSLLLVGLFVLAPCLKANADQSFDFKRLLKKYKLKAEDMSLIVEAVESKKTILAHRQNSLVTPASVTKILVAGAALDEFDPGDKFETKLFVGKEARNSKTKSIQTLYLKGMGDPSFTSERMWFLVNEFVRTGIKKVEGDIVIDSTYFDEEKFHEGRIAKRVDRAYDAPVSAASFNWNSLNVYYRRDFFDPARAAVFLDPQSGYGQLNEKVGVSNKRKSSVKVSRTVKDGSDQIHVSGYLGKSSEEDVQFKSVTQTTQWVGKNLISFLDQRGIEVGGKVRAGKVPSDAEEVAKSPGATVTELVRMMMKFSNNFIAEMLTKQLSAANGDKPGNIDGGLRVIEKHIEKMGLSPEDFRVSSVSGLSRKNEFKNSSMIRLIKRYQSNFKISPEFLASLPVSGHDGTLKSRMTSGPAKGRVRAKTGLLSNASTLAGFYQNVDGETFAFSFSYNGNGGAYRARNFFDDLLSELVVWSN